MRKPLLLMLLTLLSSVAQAGLINVYQGGSYLGQVSSYQGALSAEANYGYSGATNHLTTGPSLSSGDGHIFFYQGSDGLSFNAILGSGGSRQVKSKVHWDITVSDNQANAQALVKDDNNEFTEDATDFFDANWNYNHKLGDGGVIGPLLGLWQITIDPKKYEKTALVNLQVFSAAGAPIALAINTTDDIVFNAVATPAPTWLLAAGLLALVRKRQRG